MAELLRTNRLIWGAIALVITVVGALSLASSSRYSAAVRAVERTLTVKAAIDGTLSLLKDAETGQRGFILTGDLPFLEPYDTALRALP
ncbi:MAG TPA: CHASE3 domain-containing protein, partial [Polyangiales bacterium]